ncbi:MAG TPA: OsmC family protein [Pseudoxanthomonas sp.]|nr:OsmC family protein [Pseudoxanthomonas sp.]
MADTHATIVSGDRNYLHTVSVGGREFAVDEPPALGGGGQGAAPYDLYLAALAACTAITLRMYAERKGWELGRLRAELHMHRAADGRMHIHRRLHASGSLDEAQWRRLLEVVENTPVTRTMREGATITSERAG